MSWPAVCASNTGATPPTTSAALTTNVPIRFLKCFNTSSLPSCEVLQLCRIPRKSRPRSGGIALRGHLRPVHTGMYLTPLQAAQKTIDCPGKSDRNLLMGQMAGAGNHHQGRAVEVFGQPFTAAQAHSAIAISPEQK